MKFVVVAYVENDEKVNPENFGDWVRTQRAKYVELLGTNKISILEVSRK